MRAELFETIRALPEDDAPRLVLADWLIDRDDPDSHAAAELIRLQCDDHVSAIASAKDWRRLARAQRLAPAAARFWLGERAVRGVCFSRGLPETLDLHDPAGVDIPVVRHLSTDLPEHAGAQPHLLSLSVPWAPRALTQALAAPERLEELSVERGFDPDALAPLAGLRELHAFHYPRPSELRAVLDRAPGLRALSWRDPSRGDVRELAHLPELTRLALHGSLLSDAFDALDALRVTDLTLPAIDEPFDLERLASLPLRALDLFDPLEGKHLDWLDRCADLERLTSFRLAPSAAAMLARAPALRALDLGMTSDHPALDDELAALRLERLDAAAGALRDPARGALARLRELTLYYVPTDLTRLLAAAPALERLTLVPSSHAVYQQLEFLPDALRPLVAPSSGRGARKVGPRLLASLAEVESLRVLTIPDPAVGARLAAARPDIVIQPVAGGVTVELPAQDGLFS